MPKDKRQRSTGRRESGSFSAFPHAVQAQRKFAELNAHSKVLLIELLFLFRGSNNGDIAAPWSYMRERGFRSKGTLQRAIQELIDAGLIYVTRQGGRHSTTLYALSWLSVDECINHATGQHKLDVRPGTPPRSTWKDGH